MPTPVAIVKRYLFLPGSLLVVSAAARFAATVQWDALNTALAAAGGALLAVSAAWNRRALQEWFRDPRGVFVVATTISTVVLFMILVLVNILVWYRPARVDLTESGRNTVSGETRGVLSRLETDVRLLQFGRTRNARVDQLLSTFADSSRRVTVEFVDADRNPRDTQKYGVVKNGTVVAIAGEKFRRVDDPTEQALVTAVLQVTSDTAHRVCFVTGHGERGLEDASGKGLSQLTEWLAASNFAVERLSLLEGDVPATCSAVVVAGPTREFEHVEMTRLSAYSDGGGRVALLLDPAPGLSFAEWLEPRGIRPGNGLVVDTTGAGQSLGGGAQTPLALRYGDHPITRGFEIATMFDWARPVEPLERPAYGGRPVALASTSERSFEEMETGTQTVRFDAGQDRRGPLTLAVATSLGDLRRAETQSRLVVFGDSDFITNGFLRRQGNATLFLRTISWLVGEAEATVVSVQDRENRRVAITEQQRVWMYVINVGLLPLIPLVIGVIVYLRSRH